MLETRRTVLLGGVGLAGLGILPAGALAATGGVNVRDFGARGDGVTIDTAAIERAIAAAAQRGGGTVYFPAGTYASYTIHLRSRITLYLDAGATLLAASVPLEGTTSGGYDTAEPQDPKIEPFQDFGHNHWRNSLIYGEGLHDIAILGEGMIWGKGLSRSHDEDVDLPKAKLPGVGNKAIALKNCHNVQLRDFKILKGGHFGVLATGVDNLVIDNLTVDTDRDGLDIDCCRNVRVSRCTVNSPYDDGICPKSSFALGYNRATENLTISDCYVTGTYEVGSVIDGSWKRLGRGTSPTTGRIKCGTESNGGFKNITITNCVFDNCKGLALESVDGALLEDVAISNITMRGVTTGPLFLRLGARLRGPAGATKAGTLKRVMISNITSSGATRLPSIIAGVPGFPVEDVHLSDLYLEQVGGGDDAMAHIQAPENAATYPEPTMFGALPATGFFVRHAKGLVMRGVEVVTLSPDPRPAFWMQDVDDVDCFDLRVARGPFFALNDVSRFRNFGSLTVPDRQFGPATSVTF